MTTTHTDIEITITYKLQEAIEILPATKIIEAINNDSYTIDTIVVLHQLEVEQQNRPEIIAKYVAIATALQTQASDKVSALDTITNP